jgi:Protein of unknown function (DUF3617)
MKYLLVALVLVSASSFASLNMKPGLWKVDMNIESGGKSINPKAELAKAMANMTPEQRKQMTAMMGKMGSANVDSDGIKVCYSEETLKTPEKISQHDKKDCKTNIVSQSSSKVVSTINCADGTTGDSVITMKNDTYGGVVNVKSPKHGKSTTTFNGKYLGSDCKGLKAL